ncbi:MAG: general secretion pathway protein GspB [Candidatus Thiodiazotropha sp. (ex Dulcina madagascariensis)]|nr:general secretion pathway protein GspB [Candidatus Thiodiazotropha sp. (ex Dulcina madagascariensis)]MCU7928045.1 general secretion pathway protein GspB [Candidatus Thiodiazotropha sp. (ex Dulcina madagascariensis)]
MSSILDALERASRERQPGKRDILPGANPREHKGSEWRPWLLAMLFALMVAVVGYRFIFIPAGESGTVQIQAAAPAGEGRGAGSDLSPPKRNLQLGSGSGTVSLNSDVAEDRIRRSGRPNPAPLITEAVLSQATQEKRRERAKSQDEVVLPDILPPEDGLHGKVESTATTVSPGWESKSATLTDDAAKEGGRLRIDKRPAEPVQAAVGQQPEVSETVSQIPLVWELSQGLREALGALKISIHVYSEDPGQRFVIIDMRRYSEGDILPGKGYRLESIDQDGIVIDYGDGLVRLQRE